MAEPAVPGAPPGQRPAEGGAHPASTAGTVTKLVAPAAPRRSAAEAAWAAAVSGAAQRLPSFLCLLAQVAWSARALRLRVAQVVEAGPLDDQWRVALRSAAGVIAAESGVELDVRSGTEALARRGPAPLGCLAVDVGHAEAVSTARQLLGRPPSALLPRVLVPVRSLPPAVGAPGPLPPAVAALGRGLEGRRMRPAAMTPWPAGRGEGRALEQLFVLDVTGHPLHHVVPLDRDRSILPPVPRRGRAG